MKDLISSAVGTTAMTWFSYWYSRKAHGHFREPELLGEIIARWQKKKVNRKHLLAGFALHYAVGYGFALGYEILWKTGVVKPNIKTGALLGAISGFFGKSVWKLMFKGHPDPPKIRYKEHYFQLIPAHIIFGAVTSKIAQGWDQ